MLLKLPMLAFIFSDKMLKNPTALWIKLKKRKETAAAHS